MYLEIYGCWCVLLIFNWWVTINKIHWNCLWRCHFARKEMEKTLMVIATKKKEDHTNEFDDYAENGSPLIKLQHFCICLAIGKLMEKKKTEWNYGKNAKNYWKCYSNSLCDNNTNKCAQKSTHTHTHININARKETMMMMILSNFHVLTQILFIYMK